MFALNVCHFSEREFCDFLGIIYAEDYRSGHNEVVLKTVAYISKLVLETLILCGFYVS